MKKKKDQRFVIGEVAVEIATIVKSIIIVVIRIRTVNYLELGRLIITSITTIIAIIVTTTTTASKAMRVRVKCSV